MNSYELRKIGIDPGNLPAHIAVIMDGNGRWAKKRFLPRIAGHRAGVKSVDRIVSVCRKIGIKALTLYSFSTENWNRPASEVDGLMNILKEYLKKELKRMLREGIRFNTIGNIQNLPDFAREIIQESKEQTIENNSMVLTLALSYGAREELVSVFKKLGTEIQEGRLDPESIDSKKIEDCLYTNDLPEVDLLIRTSGEIRISNFLLWQIAYSELYFTNTLWPDYKEQDLFQAIKEYQHRERRFGKTGEQLIQNRQAV